MASIEEAIASCKALAADMTIEDALRLPVTVSRRRLSAPRRMRSAEASACRASADGGR